MSLEQKIAELMEEARELEEAKNDHEEDDEDHDDEEDDEDHDDEDEKNLDELSKTTLGNYISKASKDAVKKDNDSHRYHRVAAYNYDKSRKSKLPPEHEQAFLDRADRAAEQAKAFRKKKINRVAGIDRAVNKLTEESLDEMSQEEFDSLFENLDQLDELSKATLGNYIKKATQSAIKQDRTYDKISHDGIDYIERSNKKNISPEQKKEYDAKFLEKHKEGKIVAKKRDQRFAGIQSAAKRLTKESSLIDLGSLFEGEQFSEEFKTTATEMFEAAVNARVKQELDSLSEELIEQSLNEGAQLREGLVDKVDGYLDYVVEQWMNKNELALERGIKLEIFESFVSGMKDLLESHYIEAPDSKFDLMESVDAKAQTLEEELNEATSEIVRLRTELKEIAKSTQIQEACKGLSELESERVRQLAEELSFDNEENFARKLNLIKESMAKPSKQKTLVESVVTDSPVGLNEETYTDPTMARYIRAIK